MPGSAFFKTSVPVGGSQLNTAVAKSEPTNAEKPYQYSSSSGTSSSRSNNAAPAASGLVRNWKFPGSRKYLWDTTASGETKYLQAQAHAPIVDVGPDVLQAALAQRPKHPQSIPLLARFFFYTSKQLKLFLQPAAGHKVPGDADVLPIACKLLESGQGTYSQADGPDLKNAFKAGLDKRGQAQLNQLFSASCSLVFHEDGSASLAGCMLLPASTLVATPLYSKRLPDLPLAHSLTQPSSSSALGPEVENGLVTMDQSRSFLPLAADDPNVYSIPLVGVWVKGASSIDHPLVLAACLRFAYCSTFPDKAMQQGGAFILLLFPPEGSPLPKCYECRFEDGASLSLQRYAVKAELLRDATASVSARAVPDNSAPCIALSSQSPLRTLGASSPVPIRSGNGQVRDGGSKIYTSPNKAMRMSPDGVRDSRGKQTASASLLAAAVSGANGAAAVAATSMGAPDDTSPTPAPRSNPLPAPFMNAMNNARQSATPAAEQTLAMLQTPVHGLISSQSNSNGTVTGACRPADGSHPSPTVVSQSLNQWLPVGANVNGSLNGLRTASSLGSIPEGQAPAQAADRQLPQDMGMHRAQSTPGPWESAMHKPMATSSLSAPGTTTSGVTSARPLLYNPLESVGLRSSMGSMPGASMASTIAAGMSGSAAGLGYSNIRQSGSTAGRAEPHMMHGMAHGSYASPSAAPMGAPAMPSTQQASQLTFRSSLNEPGSLRSSHGRLPWQDSGNVPGINVRGSASNDLPSIQQLLPPGFVLYASANLIPGMPSDPAVLQAQVLSLTQQVAELQKKVEQLALQASHSSTTPPVQQQTTSAVPSSAQTSLPAAQLQTNSYPAAGSAAQAGAGQVPPMSHHTFYGGLTSSGTQHQQSSAVVPTLAPLPLSSLHPSACTSDHGMEPYAEQQGFLTHRSARSESHSNDHGFMNTPAMELLRSSFSSASGGDEVSSQRPSGGLRSSASGHIQEQYDDVQHKQERDHEQQQAWNLQHQTGAGLGSALHGHEANGYQSGPSTPRKPSSSQAPEQANNLHDAQPSSARKPSNSHSVCSSMESVPSTAGGAERQPAGRESSAPSAYATPANGVRSSLKSASSFKASGSRLTGRRINRDSSSSVSFGSSDDEDDSPEETSNYRKAMAHITPRGNVGASLDAASHGPSRTPGQTRIAASISAAECVRTLVPTTMENDSEESDEESDLKLLRKYGLK